MTNLTRQKIIDAHEALDEILKFTTRHPEVYYLKQQVFAALPPKPALTMAETKWDSEQHYLAEAETENGIKVVMLSQDENAIKCIQPPNAGDVVIRLPRKELTPTGRHYTPTQPQED
nr:MAG TPA_asm: hypothetical protein [Caudoviricetes sp.]